MKYLGIFESELPNFREIEIGDFFLLKTTSPLYDRYEPWRACRSIDGTLSNWTRIGDADHGMIICEHREKHDDTIVVALLNGKYNLRRRYTTECPTLEDAIDLLVSNYLRHSIVSRLPCREGDEFELYAPYKGQTFFNYFWGNGLVGIHYFSGYIRKNGKTYAKDDHGRSALSGERMTLDEVLAYFRTLQKLDQSGKNK